MSNDDETIRIPNLIIPEYPSEPTANAPMAQEPEEPQRKRLFTSRSVLSEENDPSELLIRDKLNTKAGLLKKPQLVKEVILKDKACALLVLPDDVTSFKDFMISPKMNFSEISESETPGKNSFTRSSRSPDPAKACFITKVNDLKEALGVNETAQGQLPPR